MAALKSYRVCSCEIPGVFFWAFWSKLRSSKNSGYFPQNSGFFDQNRGYFGQNLKNFPKTAGKSSKNSGSNLQNSGFPESTDIARYEKKAWRSVLTWLKSFWVLTRSMLSRKLFLKCTSSWWHLKWLVVMKSTSPRGFLSTTTPCTVYYRLSTNSCSKMLNSESLLSNHINLILNSSRRVFTTWLFEKTIMSFLWAFQMLGCKKNMLKNRPSTTVVVMNNYERKYASNNTAAVLREL